VADAQASTATESTYARSRQLPSPVPRSPFRVRYSDDVEHVVHDNVNDAVREAFDLVRTNVGLVQEREPARSSGDLRERGIDSRNEADASSCVIFS
jgi:hypothetical protein